MSWLYVKFPSSRLRFTFGSLLRCQPLSETPFTLAPIRRRSPSLKASRRPLRSAEGRVVRLLGNHELMVLQGEAWHMGYSDSSKLARSFRREIARGDFRAAKADDFGGHWIFDVGGDRGGWAEVGGIFWNDFSSFARSATSRDLPQISGHSTTGWPGAPGVGRAWRLRERGV